MKRAIVLANLGHAGDSDMTNPRISIIRLSDGEAVESMTMAHTRGRVWSWVLTRAHMKAEQMTGREETYRVVVDRVSADGQVIGER
jgi:hypothetical protein